MSVPYRLVSGYRNERENAIVLDGHGTGREIGNSQATTIDPGAGPA
jgi:hypothetical protein